ncbi:polysaccharide pyruvyl transferase family protein [Coleofasciculus chthonoplastes]|uniref:polysaccharide pyruvyl transferase family protein n=1 Tax=Coleofasciculus chthonoplastes TaxID=64178 RepID=UPI0032F1F58F
MEAIITGITGLSNRGVEAIVVPTIEQLCHRQPDLSIKILTETPAYDQNRLQNYNINLVDTNDLMTGYRTRLRKLQAQLSQLYPKLLPKYQTVKQLILDASVVIASGGDLFSSDYGGFHYQTPPLEVAFKANTPVVFLAQSIGPFKTDQQAKAWVQIARRSQLITVREPLSYDYVTRQLGISSDLVKQTADPAFLLQPPSSEEVARILNFYGITSDQPIVAISPSQGICRYARCNAKEHLKSWCEVIRTILNELDAQVLIIPHVQEFKPTNNDLTLATNLLRDLNFDPRVRLASADHTASEFKGLIGACNLVISERMHAAMAGLSSGVCTLVVGYSVKARGIMTRLLGTESMNNGLLIPIQQFLDPDVACTTLRQAWSRRTEVANQLTKVLPQIKEEAATNFDLITKILG